ncbi:MAG TPA: hypothetical protein PLR61_02390, partial [Rectinema sp.]|nr:hypothetical protein [Rectinema sp.]
ADWSLLGWTARVLGDRGWGLLGCSGTEVGTKENVWMRLGFRGYLDDARCSAGFSAGTEV